MQPLGGIHPGEKHPSSLVMDGHFQIWTQHNMERNWKDQFTRQSNNRKKIVLHAKFCAHKSNVRQSCLEHVEPGEIIPCLFVCNRKSISGRHFELHNPNFEILTMFRKPKRNFRSRRKDSGTDEEPTQESNQAKHEDEHVDSPMQIDEPPQVPEELQPSVPKKIKKKKKDEPQTSTIHKSGSAAILSFEQEEDGT